MRRLLSSEELGPGEKWRGFRRDFNEGMVILWRLVVATEVCCVLV